MSIANNFLTKVLKKQCSSKLMIKLGKKLTTHTKRARLFLMRLKTGKPSNGKLLMTPKNMEYYKILEYQSQS